MDKYQRGIVGERFVGLLYASQSFLKEMSGFTIVNVKKVSNRKILLQSTIHIFIICTINICSFWLMKDHKKILLSLYSEIKDQRNFSKKLFVSYVISLKHFLDMWNRFSDAFSVDRTKKKKYYEIQNEFIFAKCPYLDVLRGLPFSNLIKIRISPTNQI